MAKAKLANKDNHTCLTNTDLQSYQDHPTTAKAQKIQEAADQCEHCKTLVALWKESH